MSKVWVLIELEGGDPPTDEHVHVCEKEQDALELLAMKLNEQIAYLRTLGHDDVVNVASVVKALQEGKPRVALARWSRVADSPTDFVLVEREVRRGQGG